MAGKTILRILRVEFAHEPVARHLGDDAGRRDAQAERIAADQCRVPDGQSAHRKSVDQCMGGFLRKFFYRAGHGQVRRAQNVQPVDFRDGSLGHRPKDSGGRGERLVEFFAFCRADFFRIGQALQFETVRQDHRRGNNGPGQRSTAGFIHAGDQKKPAGAQGALAG